MNQSGANAKTREARVVELLAQPFLARLGTVNPNNLQPHVVPVWFLWEDESLWISAFTSTRKVKDIQRNQRCAVLIEPNIPSEGEVQAVLMEGIVQLHAEQPFVAEMSERIYEKYMGPEGVKGAEPQSWKTDQENRLIQMTPEKVFVW